MKVVFNKISIFIRIIASGFIVAWIAAIFWVMVMLGSNLATDACDLNLFAISILASTSGSIWMGLLHRWLKQNGLFILFMVVPIFCFFMTPVFPDFIFPPISEQDFVQNYPTALIQSIILSDVGVLAGHGLSMLIERVRNRSLCVINRIDQ